MLKILEIREILYKSSYKLGVVDSTRHRVETDILTERAVNRSSFIYVNWIL